MVADQARFCCLRRSPSDPSARAPKRRRTAPDGPQARNRPPPPATVVSDQLSKDENVCSCLNGIRFVPKMPPLLGHAPRAGCFWLESRWGFPNRGDFDSTCWLGGGQQECRSRTHKTYVTGCLTRWRGGR